MKTKPLFTILLLVSVSSFAQQQITFPMQQINFNAAPRTTMDPMSIKLWDNYVGAGAPSSYGSVLEFYGRSGHQTGQFYFGGWDNSKIRYREAFYDQNNWSDWITLLDSKNDVSSAGRLLLTGTGDHYIANGNVGIGTTTPNAKLTVNGTIRAKEVKVEATNWPDYVFEENYILQTPEELEKYIKLNKHLPEMPSAQAVADNGINLGEMNKLLLKKQEELTLLLIQQHKQVQQLAAELKAIKTRLNKEKK